MQLVSQPGQVLLRAPADIGVIGEEILIWAGGLVPLSPGSRLLITSRPPSLTVRVKLWISTVRSTCTAGISRSHGGADSSSTPRPARTRPWRRPGGLVPFRLAGASRRQVVPGAVAAVPVRRQNRAASQSGHAAASASSAARTLSPASSVVCSARPPRSRAWSRSAAYPPPAPGPRQPAWPAAHPAPPLPARERRPGRGTRSARCDRTPACQAQPQRVLPVQPGPHRLGRLPVVRSSAICSTVTTASRDGGHPGRPRAPNAAANSSSAIPCPSRSRTATASGTRRPAYFTRIAAATTGSGSGHGTTRIDITHPILRPQKGEGRPHRHTGPPRPQDHGPCTACRELTTNINRDKMAGSPNRNRPVSWVGDTGIEPVTSSV